MKQIQTIALFNFAKEFHTKIPDNSITQLVQITDIIEYLTTKELDAATKKKILRNRDETKDQLMEPDDDTMGFGKKRSRRKSKRRKSKRRKSKRRKRSRRKSKRKLK